MEEIPEKEPTGETVKPRCLNCEEKMPRKAVFCPHCGQRNNQGKVSMKELLRRFWSNISHLDAKFVKMCWQLLIPGRVTMEYFAGRQKRYPHPVQFFFVVMFFFLLLFSKVVNNAPSNGVHFNTGNGNFNISSEGSNEEEKVVRADQINFYESLQHYVWGKELRNGFDSLPAEWRTSITQKAIDSVVTLVNGKWEEHVEIMAKIGGDSSEANAIDTIPLNFFDKHFYIALSDLVELNSDEILDKYEIHDWMDRILLTQGIKSLSNSQSLISTYAGSLGWTVLLLITIMSGLLYLLYIRRKRYYVEHFVFLMHQNSGAFLLLTLGLLARRLGLIDASPIIWMLLIVWISVSLLIAMKRFYGQNWPKTVLKWFIYCTLYGMTFVFVFIISLLTVFLIF